MRAKALLYQAILVIEAAGQRASFKFKLLGVQAVKNVNDLFEKFVKGRDRTPPIQRMMTRHGWSYQRAERATKWYDMFLCIAAVHVTVTLVPCTDMDKVWEEHILCNTQEYVQICHDLCGRLLNHVDQKTLAQAEDFKDVSTSFEHTKHLFEEHFGPNVLEDDSHRPAACGRPGMAASE